MRGRPADAVVPLHRASDDPDSVTTGMSDIGSRSRDVANGPEQKRPNGSGVGRTAVARSLLHGDSKHARVSARRDTSRVTNMTNRRQTR